MDYKFYDCGDEKLIETSELPSEGDGGIALAVRTTGYDWGTDEVVELAVVDLSGAELFSQRVKPQNADGWEASDASGGIGPEDVAEASDLFQFEDEIVQLIEEADVVVAAHLPFVSEALESSWISLPKFDGVDLIQLFCQSHCTTDYPDSPAAVASLPAIAAYYDLPSPAEGGSLVAEAALVAACYRAIVAEHKTEREAKGADHWRRFDEAHADERAEAARASEVDRKREHRLNQMNGLLWIASAIIFISLTIQLYQRGTSGGILIVTGGLAVFAIIRSIASFRR